MLKKQDVGQKQREGSGVVRQVPWRRHSVSPYTKLRWHIQMQCPIRHHGDMTTWTNEVKITPKRQPDNLERGELLLANLGDKSSVV